MKKAFISIILTLGLGPALTLAESTNSEAFSRVQPALEFLLMSGNAPPPPPPPPPPPGDGWVSKKMITPQSGTYAIDDRQHLKFKKLDGEISKLVVRLNGKKITKKILKCKKKTNKYVCKNFKWKKWGVGLHTLEIRAKFSDGRKYKDRVTLKLTN